MKIIKLVAILAIVLTSFSVQAVCPTQQTTIFFINGVDNTIDDAKLSRQTLEEALNPDPRYNPDCSTVKLAYNKSEGFGADFAEAMRQRTLEAGLTPTNFWEMFERLIPAQNWFTDAFGTAMTTVQTTLYDPRDAKIFAQINEHIDTLYRLEPAANQLLFVGHSQGNFFANEERLGMLERYPQIATRTKIVSIATPSNNVAGDTKPYTTLTEDKLITSRFAATALAANLTNGATSGPCSILGGLEEFGCHGWIESYMVPESNSRGKIIGDIIASLPAAVGTPGAIIYQPADSYSPYNEGTNLFIAPYCVWFGDSRFSACQANGSMAFTPSSTTTLGSVQLGIMQQNANDTVTVKVCTTSNCAIGTVIDTSLQFLPVFPIASTSGTLDSINQPVFAFPSHVTLIKNVTYYVVVSPASTLVYICSPYNHFGVSNALFVVKS